MTTFFSKTEVFVNKAIHFIGFLVNKAQEKSEGWGGKVDVWWEDKVNNRPERHRDFSTSSTSPQEQDNGAPEGDVTTVVKPPVGEPVVIKELDDLSLPELKNLAKERNLKGYSSLNKKDLIDFLKENV